MSSNQNYGGHGGGYQPPHDSQNQAFPSTNPWADQHGSQPPQQHYQQQQQPQYSQYPPQQQHQQQQHQYSQYPQQTTGQAFEPPPGPPPRRTDTFNDVVPPSERGEQREMMEHFEQNRTKPQDQTDKDVAQLQSEFPKIDSSLIAALYSDSQSISGTREMLVELASSEGQ